MNFDTNISDTMNVREKCLQNRVYQSKTDIYNKEKIGYCPKLHVQANSGIYENRALDKFRNLESKYENTQTKTQIMKFYQRIC